MSEKGGNGSRHELAESMLEGDQGYQDDRLAKERMIANNVPYKNKFTETEIYKNELEEIKSCLDENYSIKVLNEFNGDEYETTLTSPKGEDLTFRHPVAFHGYYKKGQSEERFNKEIDNILKEDE